MVNSVIFHVNRLYSYYRFFSTRKVYGPSLPLPFPEPEGFLFRPSFSGLASMAPRVRPCSTAISEMLLLEANSSAGFSSSTSSQGFPALRSGFDVSCQTVNNARMTSGHVIRFPAGVPPSFTPSADTSDSGSLPRRRRFLLRSAWRVSPVPGEGLLPAIPRSRRSLRRRGPLNTQ